MTNPDIFDPRKIFLSTTTRNRESVNLIAITFMLSH